MGLRRYFFCFQAEDGIRDRDVTGVQTCALPISLLSAHVILHSTPAIPPIGFAAPLIRSEERRVGKSVDLGGRRIIKKKKNTIKKKSSIIIEKNKKELKKQVGTPYR